MSGIYELFNPNKLTVVDLNQSSIRPIVARFKWVIQFVGDNCQQYLTPEKLANYDTIPHYCPPVIRIVLISDFSAHSTIDATTSPNKIKPE